MATLSSDGLSELAGYIQQLAAGPSKTIRVLACINAAVAFLIYMLFLVGFAVRVFRRNLRWIHPILIPAIWCILASGFIPLHCLVASLTTAQSIWAIFNVSFLFTETSICLAAIIVCLAWVARVPSVRTNVERYASKRRAAGKRFSPLAAYITLVLLSAALFFASTLPQTVKYFSTIDKVFSLLGQLAEKYNSLEKTGDFHLIQQVLDLADELRGKSEYVTGTLVKYAGFAFAIWSSVWILCIVTSAVLLRKSIEVCIASLPAVPAESLGASLYNQDNMPLPVSPGAASAKSRSANLELQMESGTRSHTSYLHKSPSYPALPKDRPFGNCMMRSRTTLHPRHFQVVLDAPTISSGEKTRQLRVMLKKDAYLSGLFLLVLMLTVGDALFVACGAFNFNPESGHLKPQTALLVYYTWGSYAFFIPAIPSSTSFLLTSLRLAPSSPRRPSARSGSITTFNIPLVTASGIGIQQSCEIGEEYGGKEEKLDFEADSLPGLTTVRYT